MNGYDLNTTPVPSMFIEHEIRIGMVELYAQQIVALRAESRNWGSRASAMYRAGRKIVGIVNACIDCGHDQYDPEEYLVDCNTPRCPKRQQPKTITLARRS